MYYLYFIIKLANLPIANFAKMEGGGGWTLTDVFILL